MRTPVNEKNQTILILDDELSIREALKAAFELTPGYTIDTVSSFEEFESRKGALPHIIFLDMRLGEKDGKEVAQKLKSAAFTKNIPLIMMSGYPGAKEQCLKAGADDFLEKPFSAKTLLDTVDKYSG